MVSVECFACLKGFLVNGVDLQAVTNNPHVAEERNMIVDDTGLDEEQK
jgi:hypothetical protein